MNRGEQIPRLGVLDYVSGSSGAKKIHDVSVRRERGKTQDLYFGAFRMDLCGGAHAVEDRHLHVHEDQVWSQGDRLTTRHLPVSGLTNHAKGRVQPEIVAQGLARQRLVIDQ